MINNNNHDNKASDQIALPKHARLPINHCNLPAIILGSLTFQRHPVALELDGVQALHRALFDKLASLHTKQQRAEFFMDYMVVHFRMRQLEDAGYDRNHKNNRSKADYLRMLRGWLFDADSREAAVLKSWVESRFGLLPRHHKTPLRDYADSNYQQFLQARAEGLYATNALEAQLDLLYSYCQYELADQYRNEQQLTLYRGVNQVDSYEVLQQQDKHHAIVLLNNLNSFTSNRERADEFGDYILEVSVPWQKVLFYSDLLPGTLKGEDEVLVIGGVYAVEIGL